MKSRPTFINQWKFTNFTVGLVFNDIGYNIYIVIHDFCFQNPNYWKSKSRRNLLSTDLHDPNSILETWNLTELPVQFFENITRQDSSYHMYRGKRFKKYLPVKKCCRKSSSLFILLLSTLQRCKIMIKQFVVTSKVGYFLPDVEVNYGIEYFKQR